MDMKFLDFEQPIADLEAKIDELKFVGDDREVNIGEEIARLKTKSDNLTKSIFASLSAWQIAQLARHPQRPYTTEYLEGCFEGFQELHGDRMFGDDPAIIAGFARFKGEIIAIVGHQKGRTAKDKAHRNFGMAHPEGYRKAIRVMQLAERAGRPVFTFIDTPGAYPGLGAEERGQAEAIGRSIEVMSGLRVPVLATIIGEGGSGGALAIGVANRVLMFEYATYSVITPEGCASILWRDATRVADAAQQLRLLANDAKRLGVVDEVVPEPAGGAHRKPETAAESLRERLGHHLGGLRGLSGEELVSQRYQRFRALGTWQ